jgi:arylsulfatase B
MAVSLPGLSETNPASAASKTTSKSATASKTSTKTPTKTPAKTKTKSTANPKSTVATTAVTESTGSKSAPPNIVFVLADDMGVDASPCYPAFGTVKPKMPNVEKLCNEGVVFDNMTASPVCSPSRAAALTGKYGFRTNVGNVDDQLSSEETTALDVVASAPIPYANAVIGKWHLAGAQPDPTQPERLGAQYYDGFLRGAVQNYSSWPRVTQGQTNTSSTYTTTALADSAIAWTGKQTKPWLLWLAFNAPHAPFHLPPANLLSNSTLSGAATDITQNPRNYYFAAMEALDTELGRFLQSIPPATRSNTVVLFMGDNGTPAHVIQAPFAADTSKGTVAEGGVHVPLIVAGAGVTEKGKRSAALLNGVDVFSTIAELARTKPTAPGRWAFLCWPILQYLHARAPHVCLLGVVHRRCANRVGNGNGNRYGHNRCRACWWQRCPTAKSGRRWCRWCCGRGYGCGRWECCRRQGLGGTRCPLQTCSRRHNRLRGTL